MFGTGITGTYTRMRTGVALLLGGLLLAGCGDGSGDDKPKGRTTPTPTTSAPAPDTTGALTSAQLNAAALADGQKVGRYTASEYTLGAPLGESYTAAPAVCQPLVSLAEEVADPDPAAEVHRNVDVPDELTGTTVSIAVR